MSDGLIGAVKILAWVLSAFGGITMVVSVLRLGLNLIRPPEDRSATPAGGIALGMICLAGGFLFPWLLDGTSQGGSTASGPSATPTPSSTAAPTSSAPAPEPNPISLPKLENADTLWLALGLLLGVIVVAFVVYVIVKRIARDLAKARAVKAARLAREARLDRKWQEIVDRHRDLEKRFLEAETDWDMLFNYPALTDVTVPTTAAMVRAMQAAADADSHRPEDLDETTDLSMLPYPRAVTEFGMKWDAALRYAKKIGQSGIPKEERKQIEQIRALLALAENSGASESERRVAYERAHVLIKKLQSITLPAKAVAAIEEHTRLSLVR